MSSFLETTGHGLELRDYVAAVPVYGSKVFADWEGYRAARQRVDQLILDWSDRWLAEDSAHTVSRKTRSGEMIVKWRTTIPT